MAQNVDSLREKSPITDPVLCKELLYPFEDEVFSWLPTTHILCTLTNQNKSLLAVSTLGVKPMISFFSIFY
jgi:hypothetical protein